jgi:hypothetical protein
VLVSASTGDVIVNGVGIVVNGSDFSAGRATATVQMFGTDPLTRNNILTVTASKNYPGQPVGFLAAGSTVVNIDPAAYNKIVLLFPGERLNPGRIFAPKLGAASAATASVPIANVLLYLVDAYANPIAVNPGGVTISYRSVSHPVNPNADVVPGLRLVPGNADLMNNLFSCVVSGVAHTIEAKDISTGKTDQSTFFVNSGVANTIEISTVTSPRLAIDLLAFTARVTDGTPARNTVLTYNGPATVSVFDCGGIGLPVNPNFLDTDPGTAGVQATINFTNGVFAGGPIYVFKEFLQGCFRSCRPWSRLEFNLVTCKSLNFISRECASNTWTL